MLQTTVIDMEWNSKWDWENHEIFSSKGDAIPSPKKLQSSEDIDGSFNLSGVVNIDNNSSSFYNKINGNSPSLEASVCSSDQSIGLKLGKRTYFENGIASSNSKTCSSSNVPNVKKVKLSHKSTSIARCQVEGCSLDLSSAKEYHKKHRVCENHSKSLKVVVTGLERRFCQQCSRFHGLSEFDGKKRSCRRRLSNHNARRRKPQQETIHFNSSNLSTSFYGGQQQSGYMFNNVPLAQTKPALNSVWETNLQHTTHSTAAGVYHQGANAEGLDFRRALSLLSNSSWGSCELDFSGLGQPMYASGLTMGQQGMHSVHHGLPSEYWQVDPQSVHTDIQFQDTRVNKGPFEIQFANPMDEI